MIDAPDAEFNRNEMILRDWPALNRALLAKKRTFLAYGRTSMALVALGIAFGKLIQHTWFEVAGFFPMSFGTVVFIIGLREFVVDTARFKRLVAAEKDMDRHRHDMERTRRQ